MKYYDTSKNLNSSSQDNNSNSGSSKSTSKTKATDQSLYGNKAAQYEQIWLDVNKSAIKQLKDVHPMTVYFGVKYYASDPCKLAEEITRYQFFLQCKQDILHSRLPISFELAIELFALAVQSELGDYDPQRHHDGYVSEFQFIPNQTIELEKQVALYHRNLTGQVPATAEINFLERVKWLDLYGCEIHPIQYDENNLEEYALGLNPSGVLVLRNKLKVAHYLWPRIIKTKCQGRCFLMDVIDNNGGKSGNERNRFGFRLIDKMASRRLRWSIEEHKSFYHLIHSSASLNQFRQQQQQHAKLSQRFRNSIRSAINVGSLGGMAANLHLAQQQQQQQLLQQQQKLRSSMKSLNNQTLMQQQHQSYAIDSRPPPTVVRMPSRRYSNRSFTRTNQQNQHNHYTASANGNGLPNLPVNGASTMADSQRQQAIMMMNQFNQMNNMIGKSHTLKPMPVSAKLESKEAKKNPYYQMMMMMTAANNGNSNNNNTANINNGLQQQRQQPDIAILPPGRHIVQPSIYKSSSVLNGVNHLGVVSSSKDLHRVGHNGQTMMQFFNTKPQYPGLYHSSGHESPRSTKSAIAPSSAMKMASKKLAKHQQQQLLYANQPQQQDNLVQPILAYDPASLQHQQQVFEAAAMAAAANAAANGNTDYYGVSMPFNMSNSANPSPRSVRSARLTSRHKSKSTNENLHLLHNTSNHYLAAQQHQSSRHNQQMNGRHQSSNGGSNNNNNKMLLATTQQLLQQQQSMPLPLQPLHHNLPPPGYHNGTNSIVHKQSHNFCSDNESEISKMSKPSSGIHHNASSKKRATFALNNDQANLSLNTNGPIVGMAEQHHLSNRSIVSSKKQQQQQLIMPQHHPQAERLPSDGEDDYCCSRSDCSSIDDGTNRQRLGYNNGSRSTRQVSRQVVGGAGQINQAGDLLPPAQQRRHRRSSVSQQPIHNHHHQQQQQTPVNLINRKSSIHDQEDWNAIRKRHNDFSNGKGFINMNIDQATKVHGRLRLSGRDEYDEEGGGEEDEENDEEDDDDVNNNKNTHGNSNRLVKSIANKQATPILLSLNYNQTNANNKAVQLLNLQRQQLNSQSSDTGTKSSSSNPSSVASSPQAAGGGGGGSDSANPATTTVTSGQQQVTKLSCKTTDSTASNSTTTSGYYAGSNSTGSTSVDSDSQTTVDGHTSSINTSNKQQPVQGAKITNANNNNNARHQSNKQNNGNWQEDSSRAKITLGSYAGSRMSGNRLLIGNQGHLKTNSNNNMTLNNHSTNDFRSQRLPQQQQHRHQFYLGEGTNTGGNDEDSQTNNQSVISQANSHNQQWSPLNQIQQHAPSSLKYVSFDV